MPSRARRITRASARAGWRHRFRDLSLCHGLLTMRIHSDAPRPQGVILYEVKPDSLGGGPASGIRPVQSGRKRLLALDDRMIDGEF